VLRPADAQEAAVAWQMALERIDGPTVIALSRQPIPVFAKADPRWTQNVRKGAYVALDCEQPDVVVAASGSEVSMALDAVTGLKGPRIRVVSVLSLELFVSQPAAVRGRLLPPGVPVVALGRHDVSHPDLVAALARVAELGDDHVTASVQAALQRVLDDMGLAQGDVVLHRDALSEQIIATVPGPLDDPTRSRIAVRLLDAATTSGRHGRRRDVAVRTT